MPAHWAVGKRKWGQGEINYQVSFHSGHCQFIKCISSPTASFISGPYQYPFGSESRCSVCVTNDALAGRNTAPEPRHLRGSSGGQCKALELQWKNIRRYGGGHRRCFGLRKNTAGARKPTHLTHGQQHSSFHLRFMASMKASSCPMQDK